MSEQTKKGRRTADQILFDQYAKLEERKRGLRKLSRLLDRFDKLQDDIRTACDELETSGMSRPEIVAAFEPDALTTRVLKSTRKPKADSTEDAKPATTPAEDEPDTAPDATSGASWQEN